MSGEGFLSKLKSVKGLWLMAAAALLGVALIALGTFYQSGTAKSTADDSTAQSEQTFAQYAQYLEGKLREQLAPMVGQCSVMITLKSGEERVCARDTDGERKEYVVIRSSSSSESTVTLKIIAPQVLGVAVVCQNGDDIAVQSEISKLVCALFDIPLSRVYVGG